MQDGYKFHDLYYSIKGWKDEYYFYLNKKTYVDTMKNTESPLGAMLKWLDQEHDDRILDDVEKRYLKCVVRPFRDKIVSIEEKATIKGELDSNMTFSLYHPLIQEPCTKVWNPTRNTHLRS